MPYSGCWHASKLCLYSSASLSCDDWDDEAESTQGVSAAHPTPTPTYTQLPGQEKALRGRPQHRPRHRRSQDAEKWDRPILHHQAIHQRKCCQGTLPEHAVVRVMRKGPYGAHVTRSLQWLDKGSVCGLILTVLWQPEVLHEIQHCCHRSEYWYKVSGMQ